MVDIVNAGSIKFDEPQSNIVDAGSIKFDEPQGYGLRNDGTQKGKGYFGELKRPDGKVSTELSIGVNFDGKEEEIPLLVPTLTTDEINYLLNDGKPTATIKNKAVEHAKKRKSEGKSPFADEPESNIVDAGSIKFDEPATMSSIDINRAKQPKYDSHMATLSQGPSSKLTLKSAPELGRQWAGEFVTSALLDIGTWPHKKVMSYLESMQPKDVPEGYIAKGKYKADLIKNGEWSKALSVALLDTAKTTPLGLFAKNEKNIELSELGKTSAEFAGLTVPIGGAARGIEMGALKLAKSGVPKYLVPLARLAAWAGFGTAENYSKQLFKEADSLQKIIEGEKDISHKDAAFNGMMYATGEAVIGSVVHGWRIRKSINELSKLTGKPTVEILHENLHYGKTGELLTSLTSEVANQRNIYSESIISAVNKQKAKAEELAANIEKSLAEQVKSAKASAQVFEQEGIGTGKQLISDVERHKQFLKGQALENDATVEFIGNTKVPDIFAIKNPENAFYIGQALTQDQYQAIISKYEGKLAGDVIPGYGPKLTSPKEMRPGVGKAIQNLKALRDGYEGRTPVFKRPPGDIKKEFTPEYGQPSTAKYVPNEEMPPVAATPPIPKEVPVVPVKPTVAPVEQPVAAATVGKAPVKIAKPAPEIGLTGEKGMPKFHKDLMEKIGMDPEMVYDKSSSIQIQSIVADRIKKDPEYIKKIALGEVPTPEGWHLGHFVKALENHAGETNNLDLLLKVGRSKYAVSRSTWAGKDLQAWTGQVPVDEDPAVAIRLLDKIKEENVVKKLRGKNKGKTAVDLVSEGVDTIENEIRKAAEKESKSVFNYLRKLEC